jgi:hypothetical protein
MEISGLKLQKNSRAGPTTLSRTISIRLWGGVSEG